MKVVLRNKTTWIDVVSFQERPPRTLEKKKTTPPTITPLPTHTRHTRAPGVRVTPLVVKNEKTRTQIRIRLPLVSRPIHRSAMQCII